MISFVYFDVGGVAMKDFSDTNKWDEMRQDLGITAENEKQFTKIWDKYDERLCLDQDFDDLFPLLKSELNITIPEKFSLLNDLVDRFEPNYSIWPIIQQVNQTTPVGLLTNMYPRMFNAIEGSGLLPPVAWDQVIDSSVELVKKPNREIYDLAQKRANAPAKNILFIDNTEENLEIPNSLGWQTFLYDSSDYENSSKQLIDYLNVEFG